jgi:hypothetical protein
LASEKSISPKEMFKNPCSESSSGSDLLLVLLDTETSSA